MARLSDFAPELALVHTSTVLRLRLVSTPSVTQRGRSMRRSKWLAAVHAYIGSDVLPPDM